MYQWFCCGPCWNVILAYQKSIAASKGIESWWEEQQFRTLRLEEKNPVRLSPYAYKRGDESKRQKALSLSVLDFLASEDGRPLFHIEQKTGPGSIDDMTEFRLDLNDFNDIVRVVNGTGLPAYTIHVQAGQEYQFPTRRTVIRGMCWTDIITLQKHQKRIGKRRPAGKFDDPRTRLSCFFNDRGALCR
jgi:hypothetical protein